MACPKFKTSFKMAFGSLGINVFITQFFPCLPCSSTWTGILLSMWSLFEGLLRSLIVSLSTCILICTFLFKEFTSLVGLSYKDGIWYNNSNIWQEFGKRGPPKIKVALCKHSLLLFFNETRLLLHSS